MTKIELLAPAGGLESLYAAINKGADAVYMGGSKFSARAYASNFTDDDLEKAVDYAHLYGTKIYIALNTLIKEDEIFEAFEYIKVLHSIGVDALIVQDLGIANILRKYFSDFEIHASTQMTIHNGEGALFFKHNGFQRIVLSRELSLKEIEYISKDLGIETEIFVHGALCVCYSGQCLMSSVIGGRSGNRGRCAQPCRLPYTIINKNTNEEKKAYILSPKDICNIENVEDLINSGTSSLKIEGRMKRPEYVAGVVETYKKAIDSYNKKHKIDKLKEKRKLMQLFNREGFSKAYFYGNKGKDMMAYNIPKNTGLFIGQILKDNSIILEEDIALEDGIRVGEGGFALSKIIKDKEEVKCAKRGEKVNLYPTNYKRGDKLYKILDNAMMKEYGVSYVNPYENKISLKANIVFNINKEIEIFVNFKGETFTATGEIVQNAINKPLSQDRIEESLKKSGDTPFKIEYVEFKSYEEGFVPVAALNAIRRDIIEQIEKFLKNSYKRKKLSKALEKVDLNRESSSDINLLVNVCTVDQLDALKEEDVEHIGINIFYRGKNALKEEHIKGISKNKKVYLKVPNIIKEEFTRVEEIIEKNLPFIEGVITANFGIINKFYNRTKIIGDYKLNIYNSYSLEYLKPYVALSCLSIELNKKDINKIMKNNLNAQILVYGNPELMVSEYCPIGCMLGGKDSSHNCDMQCMKGDFVLKDRMNEEFKIKTDIFCRSYIYNPKSINLIPNLKEMTNIESFRIDFVNEEANEVTRIIKAFNKKKWEYDFTNYTRGHYKRGVE